MFKEYNICMLIQPLLFLTGILLLIILDIGEIEYLGLTYILSHSTSTITCYVWLKVLKKYMPDYSTSTTFKVRLRYGIKTYTGNLTAFLNYRADIYILGFYVAASSIAFYSVSAQIAEKFWLLSTAISTVLFPVLSKIKREGTDNASALFRTLRIVFSINIIAAIIFYFVGKTFLNYVLGDDFLIAYDLILILLPGIISGSLAKIIAVEFSASGRPDYNYKVSIIVLITNVILNLVFIPIFGYIAAVFVCSFSYCMNLLIKIIIYKYSINNMPITDIILIKSDDLKLIGNILCNRKI